jgi:hypothetical protein
MIPASPVLTPEDLDRLLRAYQARRQEWCGPPSREAQQLAALMHQVQCSICEICLAADRGLRDKGVDPALWRQHMCQLLEQRGLIDPPPR